jgi:hypothetical protein
LKIVSGSMNWPENEKSIQAHDLNDDAIDYLVLPGPLLIILSILSRDFAPALQLAWDQTLRGTS